VWEGGKVKILKCGAGVGRKQKGPYRSEDATKGKTETVYVGIAVGVMLHRGWGGVVGIVVRLVGGMGVRGEERMDGSAGRIGPMGRSRVENTILTIILKGESTLLGRGWQRRGGNKK